MFFHEIFMNINDITEINNIIINRKSYTYPFNCFSMLLAVKYFEIFPKRNRSGFISKSFDLY